MAEIKSWTLRYREGPVVRQGTILARDLETAGKVGRAFCNREEIQRRFIAVEDPILADESILESIHEAPASPGATWDEKTAVERLAEMHGLTPEEVQNRLRQKRPPVSIPDPRQPARQ